MALFSNFLEAASQIFEIAKSRQHSSQCLPFPSPSLPFLFPPILFRFPRFLFCFSFSLLHFPFPFPPSPSQVFSVLPRAPAVFPPRGTSVSLLFLGSAVALLLAFPSPLVLFLHWNPLTVLVVIPSMLTFLTIQFHAVSSCGRRLFALVLVAVPRNMSLAAASVARSVIPCWSIIGALVLRSWFDFFATAQEGSASLRNVATHAAFQTRLVSPTLKRGMVCFPTLCASCVALTALFGVSHFPAVGAAQFCTLVDKMVSSTTERAWSGRPGPRLTSTMSRLRQVMVSIFRLPIVPPLVLHVCTS